MPSTFSSTNPPTIPPTYPPTHLPSRHVPAYIQCHPRRHLSGCRRVESLPPVRVSKSGVMIVTFGSVLRDDYGQRLWSCLSVGWPRESSPPSAAGLRWHACGSPPSAARCQRAAFGGPLPASSRRQTPAGRQNLLPTSPPTHLITSSTTHPPIH